VTICPPPRMRLRGVTPATSPSSSAIMLPAQKLLPIFRVMLDDVVDDRARSVVLEQDSLMAIVINE
jgi:hypothetical protein